MINLKDQNSLPIFGCSQATQNQEPIHLPPIYSLLDYIDETVGELKRERANSTYSDESEEEACYQEKKNFSFFFKAQVIKQHVSMAIYG